MCNNTRVPITITSRSLNMINVPRPAGVSMRRDPSSMSPRHRHHIGWPGTAAGDDEMRCDATDGGGAASLDDLTRIPAFWDRCLLAADSLINWSQRLAGALSARIDTIHPCLPARPSVPSHRNRRRQRRGAGGGLGFTKINWLNHTLPGWLWPSVRSS